MDKDDNQCSKRARIEADYAPDHPAFQEHAVAPGDPRRYFTLGFAPRTHACVLRHVNGIAAVCLASGHPVLKRSLQIKRVDFKIGPHGSDLSEVTTSGKKKRGALPVHPGFVIARLLCTARPKLPVGKGEGDTGNGGMGHTNPDGIGEATTDAAAAAASKEGDVEEEHLVYCGVKGVLVSVNASLKADPGLASRDPLGSGYIALIQLKAGGGGNANNGKGSGKGGKGSASGGGASKLIEDEAEYLRICEVGDGPTPSSTSNGKCSS
mmetsp:Transcript_44429/g.87435  ORF Transcript_44429/g.87435 Transcript_44429/m.87435 type:complete len:266 (+) Transcript_44429:50-847(+)